MPQSVVFVLVPNFSLLAFSTALEPLRVSNRLSNLELYRWVVLSPDGSAAVASNGVTVHVDAAIADYEGGGKTGPSDIVLVCGGVGSEHYEDPALLTWLRRQERHCAYIGALCTGPSLLAAAGLLDGYKCVIHWESIEGFAETYPDISVSAGLYEVDGNRLTCAGGTAALDMMLHLIAEQYGQNLATQVVEQCLADRVRDRHDQQRLSLRARLGVHNSNILKAIEFMETHLEDPVSQADLARFVGLSSRQLERLFRKHLGMPPAQYYLELRLRRARHLLQQSNLPILDAAIACGFVSASHFSKCYRSLYGRTPKEERNSGASQKATVELAARP